MYDNAMSCTINPTSFRERYWGPDSLVVAPNKSKVLVIGGGPGGLEAARTCALRGHEVTLIEARDELGGAFKLWAGLPGREFYMKSIDWWKQEIIRLGVQIRLDTKATHSILQGKPDAVIVATGAGYSRSGHGNYRDIPSQAMIETSCIGRKNFFSEPSAWQGRLLLAKV